MLPDAVRHCAWQVTHRHVRSDGKRQVEWLRGRQSRGQVTESVEVDHFRDTQWAAGTSKLHDESSLRLRKEQILVSDGHYRCTPTRDRRCRSIWKCPDDLRRVKRKLKDMIGDHWNTSPRQEEGPRIICGVNVTLERQLRCAREVAWRVAGTLERIRGICEHGHRTP